MDFQSEFRPFTIRLLSIPTMKIWADFFSTRDVHTNKSGRKNRANEIIELLYRKCHIPTRRTDRILAEMRTKTRDDSFKNNLKHMRVEESKGNKREKTMATSNQIQKFDIE